MKLTYLYGRLLEIGPLGFSIKLGWRIHRILKQIIFHLYFRSPLSCRIDPEASQGSAFVNPDFLKEISADISDNLATEAVDICNHVFQVHDHDTIRWDPDTRPWVNWQKDVVRSFHRHDFFVTLIRAIRFTGQDKYRQCLDELIRSLPQCYPIGDIIQFDKAIDIAIRFLNWSAVLTLYGKASWSKVELRYWFLQIEWIRANLSPGGNHKLLEGLAVFGAGLFFKGIRRSSIWRDQGQQIVLGEMQRQVDNDGMHASQSMYYHQVCTTHFLKFLLLCWRNKITVPHEFLSRLQLMLELIWWLKKPDDTHPMIGDGSQLVTEDREHWEARGLIPVYDRLSGITANNSDDAVDWFLSKSDTFPKFKTVLKSKRTSKTFPSSGHVVLQNDMGQYLFFNCGPFGFEPFPHHGHADALSVEVCLNGKTIVMDPGGYAYRDDAIREFIRGTSAHSTITVDNRSQSQLYGNAGVGRTAAVSLIRFINTEQWDMAEGEHDGYDPVRHKRKVYFVKNEINSFLIYDYVVGEGPHSLKALFHLAPEVTCREISSNGYNLLIDNEFVGSTYIYSDKPCSIGYHKNKDLQDLKSIISKRTGVVEFSTVIEAKSKIHLPIRFVTVFSPIKDIRTAIDWRAMQCTLSIANKRTRIDLHKPDS